MSSVNFACSYTGVYRTIRFGSATQSAKNVIDKQSTDILYLNQKDLLALGGGNSSLYVEAVEQALKQHAAGSIVQPLKPYLRAPNSHIADRIIAMPAALLAEPAVSGLKWIGSKHDNPTLRGIERASALITLNDPKTNYPIAIMEGSLISGMRTAAVTVIAAKHLAVSGFSRIACIGCGPIAKMQLSAMLEQFPQIKNIRLYDIDPKKALDLSKNLKQRFPQVNVEVSSNARTAIKSPQGDSQVLINCTVVDKPYIPFSWLPRGIFVSNISIMDLNKDVFLNADKVLVDDWKQNDREKKVINQLVEEGRFSKNNLHAELGEVVSGRKPGREHPDEIIILNPIGMAIEDIASAHKFYEKAISQGNIGTRLSLYG